MLPFWERGRKGGTMAKYFMSGTRYEKFERMMMESRKCSKVNEPQRKKIFPCRKGSREKQRGK